MLIETHDWGLTIPKRHYSPLQNNVYKIHPEAPLRQYMHLAIFHDLTFLRLQFQIDAIDFGSNLLHEEKKRLNKKSKKQIFHK